MPTTVSWTGYRNTPYSYMVYDLPFSCSEDIEGNYIFCKQEDNKWIPVYIGEGQLHRRINDPKHSECAINKGATHVHTRINEIEQARKFEQGDLLQIHPETYYPIGCNKKIGG